MAVFPLAPAVSGSFHFFRASAALGLLALMGQLQAADKAGVLDPRALVGGTSVLAATYPFVVMVQGGRGEDGQGYPCTGVLIRPTWVLTAGHCIMDDVNDVPRPYGSISVGYDCNLSTASCEEYKHWSDSPVDWKVVHPSVDHTLHKISDFGDFTDLLYVLDLIRESRGHDLALLKLASASRRFGLRIIAVPDELVAWFEIVLAISVAFQRGAQPQHRPQPFRPRQPELLGGRRPRSSTRSP